MQPHQKEKSGQGKGSSKLSTLGSKENSSQKKPTSRQWEDESQGSKKGWRNLTKVPSGKFSGRHLGREASRGRGDSGRSDRRKKKTCPFRTQFRQKEKIKKKHIEERREMADSQGRTMRKAQQGNGHAKDNSRKLKSILEISEGA